MICQRRDYLSIVYDISHLFNALSETLNLNRREPPLVIFMDTTENEKQNEKKDLEGLYDLAIPLSMPISIIQELVNKFDVDVVRRKVRMDMTGEPMDREILVLRGDLETITAAKNYMFESLDKKIGEWEKKDKAGRYKKAYEDRIKEAAKEREEQRSDGTSQGWETVF